MAAGDYVIRRNNANTDTVPDAGSDLLLLWDTAVDNNGTGITYSAGTFTLGETGRFLVLVSDQYQNAQTTNNERLNMKMTLNLGGTELEEGYSTGFIRKGSGSQEFICFSAAIINVTSTAGTADDLQVRTERIDNTVAAIQRPDRQSNDRSGITILKLDDTWGYGRYRSSAATTSSATDNTAVTMNIQTTDEEDSPFTRTTNSVDIATTNSVLAIWSLKSEDPTPAGRAEYHGRLTLAGTVVPGSYAQTYIRVTDNSDWGGMCNMCILDPTSGDDLELEVVSRDTGGEEFTAALQLVELPATAEVCIVEATTGNFNTVATNFAWDTNPVIDTGTYTHTTGQANVDVDVAGDFLVSASVATTTLTAATRAVPAISFRVNTTDIEYAGNSSYNRNSGTSGFAACATGTLLTGLSINDSIFTHADRVGTNATAIDNNSGGMFILRTDNLFTTGTAFSLTAESGAFTLGAADATLDLDTAFSLTAESGAFTLGGDAVNFILDTPNLVLQADAGDFDLTGGAVTFFFPNVPGENFSLRAEQGDFNLSAAPADLQPDIDGSITMDIDTIAFAEGTETWTAVGTLADGPSAFTDYQEKQGDECIIWRQAANTLAGVKTPVLGSGNEVDIRVGEIGVWFLNPVKDNDGNDVLDTANDAVRLRVFSGTNTADYYQGNLRNLDNEYPGGWFYLRCSGDAGSEDTNGGTWTTTDAGSVDSVAVIVRTDASNGNDAQALGTFKDSAFAADWAHYYTAITVTGTNGTQPWTFQDIVDEALSFTTGNTDEGEWGTINKVVDYYELYAALQIGDGTTTTRFSAENEYVYLNPSSSAYDLDVTVKNKAQLTFGEKFPGADTGTEYAQNGCQIFAEPDAVFQLASPVKAAPSMIVESGGVLNLYASLIRGFGTINFGSTGNPTVEAIKCDFLENDEVELRTTGLIMDNVKFHFLEGNESDIGKIFEIPIQFDNVQVFQVTDGFEFRVDMDARNLFTGDTTNDLVIKDSQEISLINSTFDETKISWIAT